MTVLYDEDVLSFNEDYMIMNLFQVHEKSFYGLLLTRQAYTDPYYFEWLVKTVGLAMIFI